MPLNEQYASMVAGVKDHLTDLLKELGTITWHKTFRCPHHLLPTNHYGYHRDTKPSATLTSDGTCFFCHACGAEGDIIDFVQMYYRVNWVTAVNWLHAKYTLGLNVEEPIANFDLQEYKAQFAPKYRDVAVERTKVKRKMTQQPALKTRARRKTYQPSFFRPAPQYTPEQYRDALLDEGERIIAAGHGAVLFRLCPDGVKRPMKLKDIQEHGAAEPIRNLNLLRNVLDRVIKTDKHVQTVYIGIALQRLICIDVDMHEGDGILHLSQLEAALGENLPLKQYESTMTGGRHFFYRLPKNYSPIVRDGLPTKVNGLLDVDGIDILSGPYAVVCAPSTGYILFDGGIMRNWFRVTDLPRKWSQLLSDSGAKLTELLDSKYDLSKTTNKEVAI